MAEECNGVLMSGRAHTSDSATPLREAEVKRGESQPNDVEAGYTNPPSGSSDHRKLAIVSIICGLSCFGIMSLIYSVKTRQMNRNHLGIQDKKVRATKAKEYSNKAFKWGVIAILTWVGLLLLLPLVMGLFSYVMTFIN